MVDCDEELGGVAALGAWVDVGVALVDALHGRGLVAAFQGADELAEDVAPIDGAGDRLADVFAEGGWDVAPPVGL